MIDVKRKNGYIVIALPITKMKRSKSGKTFVVATTHGPITTNAKLRQRHIVVVASAFVFPHEPEWRSRARVEILRAKGRLK